MKCYLVPNRGLSQKVKVSSLNGATGYIKDSNTSEFQIRITSLTQFTTCTSLMLIHDS